MKRIAQLLTDKHQEIINIWAKDVLKDVSAAKDANRIALHDHIPNILDDVIDIINRHDNVDNYVNDDRIDQIVANSEEHGRHRATSSNYTVDQIIHEYMIFNNVIIRMVNENGIYDQAGLHLIKCCIDNAILHSVASFSESIQEMQNKLVGTLAHDIRNPLAAARMAIEMLNYDAGAERFDRVKKMTYSSVNKAIDLVEGLLDSISVKAGEGIMLSYSDVNIFKELKTVYEEACEVFSEEIIFNCENEALNGVFDPTALRRLLENLISNAVKYGHSEKPITIAIKDDEDWLNISVHNFGEPIPKEKQKEIFNFLEHGKQHRANKMQSYGIGLTFVKMVTEAHNGNVNLKSEEGFGTEFTVKIHKKSTQPGKKRTQLTSELVNQNS